MQGLRTVEQVEPVYWAGQEQAYPAKAVATEQAAPFWHGLDWQ